MAASRPRVVIVGAGMAGLAAAVKLVETDMFDITVLEAMDRPGGRIHTSWQMGSDLIELGANWIHGEDDNPLYELAKDNGLLEKQDPRSDSSSSSSSSSSSDSESGDPRVAWMNGTYDGDLYVLEDGTRAPAAAIKKVSMWYNNLLIASMDESTHNGFTNVGDYFRNGLEKMMADEGLSDSERHLYWLIAKWCMRHECGDCACQSVYDMSLARFNDYVDCPGDFFTCLGRKGYQGVLDVLLGKLPHDTIRYGMPVQQIVWKQESVTGGSNAIAEREPITLRVKGQPSFIADHVIITTSVGYLRENHRSLFEPTLPVDKQEAINTMGFGTIDKIFLKFKKPFWNQLDKGEVSGIQLLWERDPWHDKPPVTTATAAAKEEPELSKLMQRILGFDTVDGHDDVLCAWISGQEAEQMEQLSDEEVGKMCTEILRKFLKRKIPKPTKVVVSRWHSNPYIRGSYTGHLPVHGTGEEYNAMTQPVCQEHHLADGSVVQHPLLLFAGEAYHKRFQSTVHGAMTTGRQQAEHLIQFHQTKSK